jgi:hypothetical protein
VLSGRWHSFAFIVYFASVAVTWLTLVTAAACFYPPFWAWVSGLSSTWKKLASILAALPYILAALNELWKGVVKKWRRRRPQIGEDEYARGVFATMKTLPFPPATHIYAVMGHTHDQDVQVLSHLNGANVVYMNTGTWIPVWPEDRPDLDGQVLFPYVHFQKAGDEYRAQYQEWRDDRGAPADSYIMAPPSS